MRFRDAVVPILFQVGFYSQSLNPAILGVSKVSAINVYESSRIVLVCEDCGVEVLIVPPETTAHANGISEKLGPCVHGVTTNQAS